jgi:hypothetical protein
MRAELPDPEEWMKNNDYSDKHLSLLLLLNTGQIYRVKEMVKQYAAYVLKEQSLTQPQVYMREYRQCPIQNNLHCAAPTCNDCHTLKKFNDSNQTKKI